MISQKIKLTNKLGLHARATAKLVALCAQFSSNIYLQKDALSANAKSMMAVMQLAAPCHTELLLLVEGEDEQKALLAIQELIDNRFGEHE